MVINKIKEIENISLGKLGELFISILKKEGYQNVQLIDKNLIKAETKISLSTISHLFYLNQKKLSGYSENAKSVLKAIENAKNRQSYNQISLVSNQTISGSSEKTLQSHSDFDIQLFSRDLILDLIEKHFPNYWIYDNLNLVEYEKYFLEVMTEKSAFLNIQGLEGRVKTMLDIYIKPRVYEIKDNIENNNVQLHRVDELTIVDKQKSAIIEGDTGSGKSTILKEIGRLKIKSQEAIKTLPIFVTKLHLRKHNFNLINSMVDLLKIHVSDSWEYVLKQYKVLLLLDGIDELDKSDQNLIVKQLNKLDALKRFNYILSTRSIESNNLDSLCSDVHFFQIRKFNDTQIREFISRFFDDKNIAANLLEALTDNRILQRLPLTPLSLSLIALVFEKENYEIPATISDIYDNFNSLILGKITSTKRFELINFNFRERILSLYALELIQNRNSIPMTKDEFIKYFKNYFASKASNVEPDVIEDFLNYFIQYSGILTIADEGYVKFSHKSFLEYYCSLEIFKHRRKLEDLLVNNFLDLNWQNISIFYAGQSKDLPEFLGQIIVKVKTASKIDEHNNAIMGLGYLLQALYQTDNNLRKQAVELALEQSLTLHDYYKKISTDGNIMLFKNMRLPSLSIFNMYFFYLSFLSSTLKEPLSMAFEDLILKYKSDPKVNIGYKLLTIAAIFHSHRLKDSSLLNKLLDETQLLNDPYLVTVAEFALHFDNSDDHKEIKNQIHKSFLRFGDVANELLSTPIKRLRFSKLDMVQSNKPVTLITEGKTDVEIIEHAYSVLTDGKIPYFKIKPANGVEEVYDILRKAMPILEDNQILIGLFDSDNAGRNKFKGLQFDAVIGDKGLKKKRDHNIYALKLPFPNFRNKYSEQLNENQYLAIEHYFTDDILIEQKMAKESGVPGIFKINDEKSAKLRFSKFIKNKKEPSDFKSFAVLFEAIDRITGAEKIDYYENI
jgi:ABC-type dipeptide/oligopeptide/nickel transport system ATPase subunit